MEERGTPDDAIARGHEAFNNSLQRELDNLITTLNLVRRSPTPDDINTMRDRVAATIHDTIAGNVSVFEWIWALGNMDNKLATSIFYFSSNNLDRNDEHTLISDTWAAGNNGDKGHYRLDGDVISNHLDYSLRKYLIERNFNPTTTTLRQVMTSKRIFSFKSLLESD